MRTRRGLTTPLIVALLVALVAVACEEGPSPEELAASEADEARFAACLDLAEEVTATLQAYVDQFSPEIEGGVDTQVPSIGDLQAAAEEFGRRRAAAGCRAREFQLLLDRALDDLEGEGPLGRAVTARVRDEVAPVPGPPATVVVAPGDDLAAAVHGAGAGAVVQLEAGRHELAEPLVLLRGTRLVGAGADTTTVASSAPGAVVLHAGDDDLSLEGITFAHEGDEPASVVVAPSGRHDLRDVAVRGGVADATGSTGWGLVLGGATAPDATDDEPTGDEETGDEAAGTGHGGIVDVVAEDNAAGGIAVTGGAPELSQVVARDNGGCGICWLGDATGSLTDAEVTGNAIGLSLAGTSAPTVGGVVATGNLQAGVLLEGTGGTPELEGLELADNGAAGLVVRGATTATVRDVVSRGHEQSGVVVEGDGAPELSEVVVSGGSVGVLVRESGAPVLVGVVVADVTDAHMVFSDASAGQVVDATCAAAAPGIALLGATTVDVTDAGCEVVDQRDG